MPVTVQCKCGKRFRAKDEFIGRRAKCPSCQCVLLIAESNVAPYDVFVSHSNADKNVADAICSTLEAAGIRCWIAPRDVVPGAEWGASIMGAISQCRLMVLVFSKNSNQSKQVRREVERAVSKGITIIPVRIEDVAPSDAMEYFISSQHWLDAVSPPFAGHLKQLTFATKSLLDANDTQPDQQDHQANELPRQTVFPTKATAKSKGLRDIAVGASFFSLVLVLIIVALVNRDNSRGSVQQSTTNFELPAAGATTGPQTGESAKVPDVTRNAFAAGFSGAAILVEKSNNQQVSQGNIDQYEKALSALGITSELLNLIKAKAPTDDALTKAVMDLPASLSAKHGDKARFSALTGTHLVMLCAVLQAEAVLDDAQRTKFRKTANVETQIRQVVVSAQLAGLPKEFIDDLNQVEASIKSDPQNRAIYRDSDTKIKLAAARIVF